MQKSSAERKKEEPGYVVIFIETRLFFELKMANSKFRNFVGDYFLIYVGI